MTIVEYKSEYKKQILDLFEICFNKKISEEYWNWRFESNPFSDEIFIDLMFDGNKLVGHYAISPIELIIDGVKKNTAFSMTTMTHPNYAGKGIFTKLANNLYERLKLKGFEMVWGFPNSNSHFGFKKNLEWVDITTIGMLKLDVKMFKNNQKLECINIYNLNEIPEILFHEVSKKVRINKNTNYIKWRYLDNPSNDYKLIKTIDNSSILIYKLLPSFNTTDKFEIDILEINFESIEHLQSLISFMISSVDNLKNIEQINTWNSIHSKDNLFLEKIGFKQSSPITYLGARLFNMNELILDYRNWDISFGYSDIF